MRFAIFKLLRKGEKDQTLAANFRPISLLSVIYKLVSCVIKNRLKKVLPQIIGKQQKAYVESDNIGAVLLNLLSSMKNYNEKKLASLILCMDFRKAFDSISHLYIQNALKKFNFGEDFCDWIKLFFSNREGRILMDGHLMEKIVLEQGVLQGDIISPFIFIIAVEILLIKITQKKYIKGVQIGKKECCAQTFADDTTILIKRDEESLRACIQYIEDFKSISGLAANLDKTNVIPYGMFFNPGCKICPDLDVKWVDNFKLFGIEIDNKLENLNINIEKAYVKAQNIISNWKARKLPIK